MALATTVMTSPLLNFLERLSLWRKRFSPSLIDKKSLEENFKTLIFFGRPQSGSRLLQLAYYLNLAEGLKAVDFSPSAEVSIIEAEKYETESFRPILQTAQHLKLSPLTEFKVTDHVVKDIKRVVNNDSYGFVLLGTQFLFDDNKAGGKVRELIDHLDCDVGVFVDRRFSQIERVLFLVGNHQDVKYFDVCGQVFAGRVC